MSIKTCIKKLYGEGWFLYNYANPNCNGYIAHIFKDEQHIVFIEPDWDFSDEPESEFETIDRVEAQQIYENWVKESLEQPNWEMQEVYDEEHGTINGYAPFQYIH